MKPNHLFTSLLAITALVVTSCSAPKLAQNAAIEDDVYNTTAKAKEYKPYMPAQTVQTDSTGNEEYYGKTNPNYDMDYASRIDRFYYGNPYRGYYDPYYNYYGYNSYYSPYASPYWSYGGSMGLFFGSYYGMWSNFYGSPYYNPYWGIYSNYNYYGTGYYGGFYGGGFYGGGYYAGRNENYRPRPTRGIDNGNARPGTGGSIPSRGDISGRNTMGRPSTSSGNYNPTNGQPAASRPAGQSRANSTEASRPSRTETRPSYTPPRESYTPPPSSSGSNGSGSSGSGSSGGSRPTRGGGRG